MIQILHTADIHLDAPLRSLALRDPALQARIRAATRAAFKTIVDVALDRRVAALLISGDLYDGAQRSARTAAFLTGQLDRLNQAGIPVFYIKGNHDAANPITGAAQLPSNVHVFDGHGGRVQLGATNIWIHGVSFRNPHAPESLLGKFAAPIPDAINIAMLHTSLSGAPGHDPYAPCSVTDLKNMGFDYWALGHIHIRKIHSDAPWVVMPGTPQGRDIGEDGAKSATLLTLHDNRITVEEIPTSAAEFHRVPVDISGIDNDDALRRHVRDRLRDIAETLQAETGVLRLILTGHSPRRWQILRDHDVWTETIAGLAQETGTLWLEKLDLDLPPNPASPAPANALQDIETLMRDIRAEPGFAAGALASLETMLGQLPADLRNRISPDQESASALAETLSNNGALRALAAMRRSAE